LIDIRDIHQLLRIVITTATFALASVTYAGSPPPDAKEVETRQKTMEEAYIHGSPKRLKKIQNAVEDKQQEKSGEVLKEK
jgi:hypothetical protein